MALKAINDTSRIFRDIADLKYWTHCLWLPLQCLEIPALKTFQTAWDTHALF